MYAPCPSSSSLINSCAIACQRESTTDNSRAVVYLFCWWWFAVYPWQNKRLYKSRDSTSQEWNTCLLKEKRKKKKRKKDTALGKIFHTFPVSCGLLFLTTFPSLLSIPPTNPAWTFVTNRGAKTTNKGIRRQLRKIKKKKKKEGKHTALDDVIPLVLWRLILYPFYRSMVSFVDGWPRKKWKKVYWL